MTERDDRPADVTPAADAAPSPQPRPGPALRRRARELAQIIGTRVSRGQARSAPRDSDALLAAAQRLARIGGWEWDVEAQTMTWTDQVYRIHDLEPDDIPPLSSEHIQRSLQCYDPADRPRVLDAFQRCVEDGQPYDLEFPFTTARGRRRWIRTAAEPVMEGGRVVKVIGHIMDITERRQAEHALRESEAFLSAVFRSIQDGISVLNTDLTIRYVNPVMEKWFASSMPLQGQRCFRAYRAREAPCEPCPTLRCIESGSVERDVVPGAPHPDSPAQWLELFCYPVREAGSNEVTAVVEFVRDITERKRARARLAEQLDELRRWHTATLGREMRILELKREVNRLLAQAGQPPRYPSAEEPGPAGPGASGDE